MLYLSGSDGKTAKMSGRDGVEKQPQKSGQDETSQLVDMCKNNFKTEININLMHLMLLYRSVDEYVYSWHTLFHKHITRMLC